MVDAILNAEDASANPVLPDVTVRLVEDRDAVNAAIDAIAPLAVHTTAQHPAFLKAWIAQTQARPAFIMVQAGDAGPVLLPLEVDAAHTARYCGGRHANGNFPVGRADDLIALHGLGLPPIASALANANLTASAIILERQHKTLRGIPNPFVDAQSVASPNIALSLALEGYIERLKGSRSGKQKLKKLRSYRRKLDAMGAVGFRHPVDKADTHQVLDRFFALKADHFRQAGIADVFGDTQTRAFFERLFADGGKTFELHALTVDGEIAAMIGCSAHQGRMTVEFGSYDPRFASARPGELLFDGAIAHAGEAGFAIFDFGIGDEPYKRAWCDIETTHHDTTIALSAGGQVRAMAQRGRSRLVRAIKSNAHLWSVAKAARKRLARRR